MYERMLLDSYSMIGGHPFTMSSFARISFLRNHLLSTGAMTRFE
jgi:hypothetical protein